MPAINALNIFAINYFNQKTTLKISGSNKSKIKESDNKISSYNQYFSNNRLSVIPLLLSHSALLFLSCMHTFSSPGACSFNLFVDIKVTCRLKKSRLICVELWSQRKCAKQLQVNNLDLKLMK